MSEMEKFNVDGEHELSVKRFYMPIEVEVECPECHAKHGKDFEDEYLSYPVTNEKAAIYMECDHCECEFEFDVMLCISLDVDSTTRKL